MECHTLDYADFTEDARRAGEIIGANPAVTNNQWLDEAAGLPALAALGMAATTRLLAAGLTPLQAEALISGTGAFAFRREGELNPQNQLALGERLVDGMISAGLGVGLLKLAQISPSVWKGLVKKFTDNPEFKLKAGGKELTLEDVFEHIKRDQGTSQQEIDFLTGQTETPPHNSVYKFGKQPIWSTRRDMHSLENAFGHAGKHFDEFDLNSSSQFIDEAHHLRSNMPTGTELKITPKGRDFTIMRIATHLWF